MQTENSFNIFLIRHASSLGNEGGLVSSTTEDPLSQRGRVQARCLSKYLNKMNLKPSFVFVSNWLRARQTAEICFPTTKMLIDTRLGELDLGDSKNDSWSAFKQVDFDVNRKFNGGESRFDQYNRVREFFNELVKDRKLQGDIFIITHAGVIECLLQYIYNIPVEEIPVFFPQNASITKLVYYDSGNLLGKRKGWMCEYFSKTVLELTEDGL